jgi:hypothetical protein
VQVPDFVTHYHLPTRPPFLNLSDLPEAEAITVMDELMTMRKDGHQHRLFGRTYLRWRKATEARLREHFVAGGGVPLRQAPHYFVLGSSAWFEGLARDMQAVRVALDDLPPEHTTFTLVDSFAAMGCGEEFGFPGVPAAPLDRLYRWPRDRDVLTDYEAPLDEPDEDYSTYANRPVHHFVELQVWCELSPQQRAADHQRGGGLR